ncbi:MAG: hypothetical protein H6739_35130 [Alphaproteobacteria bacterium]|nr:hypothetical protein [Alphaproteobacteria bacterium]
MIRFRLMFSATAVDVAAERAFARTNAPQALPERPIPQAVLDFLIQLRRLEGVPFRYLVPDARMLPNGALRMFPVDRRFLDALVDGALSVAAVDPQRSRANEQLYGHLNDTLDRMEGAFHTQREAASDDARTWMSDRFADRMAPYSNGTISPPTTYDPLDDTPPGVPGLSEGARYALNRRGGPGQPQPSKRSPRPDASAREDAQDLTWWSIRGLAPRGPITGLILRSELVEYWPGVVIEACAGGDAALGVFSADELLPVARRVFLGPSTLLVLWDGVPDLVVLREPMEGAVPRVEGTPTLPTAPLRNLLFNLRDTFPAVHGDLDIAQRGEAGFAGVIDVEQVQEDMRDELMVQHNLIAVPDDMLGPARIADLLYLDPFELPILTAG